MIALQCGNVVAARPRLLDCGRMPAMLQGLPKPLVDLLRIDLGSVDRIKPGFSGATVWSAETESGKRAIKRWPVGTTVDRVADVHRVVGRTDVMPKLDRIGAQTWFCDGGRIYESAGWLDGSVVDGDQCRGAISAATLMADFHRQSNADGMPTNSDLWLPRSTSPTLHSRIKATERWMAAIESGRLGRIAEAGCVEAGFVEAGFAEAVSASRWIDSHAAASLKQHSAAICRFASVPRPSGWTLRDVHREHILFHEHNTSEIGAVGIIDSDAIRIDTPVIDLARWIGSFDVPGDQIDEIVAAYFERWHQRWPIDLIGDEPEVIGSLIRLSTWLTLLQWTDWLWIEPKRFDAPRADQIARWQFWYRRSLTLQE